MRSDFYRYAAEQQRQRGGRAWQQRQTGGGGGGGGAALALEWQQQLQRGREWATGILQRGAGGPMMTMVQRFPATDGVGGIRRNEHVVDETPSTTKSTQSTTKSTRGAWDAAAASSIIASAPWLPWRKKDDDGNAYYSSARTNDVERRTIRGGESAKHDDDNGSDDDGGGGGGGGGGGFDKDVLLRYVRLRASVRLRQLGYVGSDFSVHLPPASPVLLFYLVLPSRQDPIRRLARYAVAGATLSWMHSECTKYRRFSPLPILRGVNVRRPNLPPFLPDVDCLRSDGGDDDDGGMETDPAMMAATVASNGMGAATAAAARVSPSSGGTRARSTTTSENNDGGGGEGDGEHSSHDGGHHPWDPFQSFGSVSSIYRTWLEGHNMRAARSAQQRRVRASDQLLSMQKASSPSASSNSTSISSSSSSSKSSTSASATGNADAGYALVTGASSGLGRAISVELARYRIPLILVARDLSRLKALADDIEKHYDVTVRIIQADLSTPDCARRIHDATTSAGLNVDILVNNAGVCAHGDFVDGDDVNMAQMVSVNVGAVTQLSRLYGREMKERRRGRILMVSSMSGVLPGNPGVSVYAATKAYEKSLASSLGREMERYGVGVTCLLPGAVKDTAFAKRSDVEDAACFNFPGYAKTSEYVAGEGVKVRKY
ncbi:hypothetical protein ACHAW5_004454 [Stephanodiscus triporus]|uniref:Uncharacterized protein n=1 Tax=Stephanodiscus triporus TaxID=2934178 RepID=A0ABD3QAP4_9STRA